MIPHDELHVVFGTGPVGLAVMRELHAQGKRVRLVNRSGTAAAPQRALYRLGRAFASHARRHYPGRGSGQCEARRD